MREKLCIFCGNSTECSKAVEHIVPESLGNKEHVLPRGVVCDTCNQYFACKIEEPVLSSPWFVNARFESGVASKRDRIPPLKLVTLPVPCIIDIRRTTEGATFIEPAREGDRRPFQQLLSSGRFSGFLPAEPARPVPRLMARFLGKIAYEAFAGRALSHPDAFDEFQNHPGFKPLKRFVRYNESPGDWAFNERRIYAGDHEFAEGNTCYEVLHEFDFLYTASTELFFVFACFGTEYVLNMGGPRIDGYLAWLNENAGRSPLYR